MRILLSFWVLFVSAKATFGQAWSSWDSMGTLHNKFLSQLIGCSNSNPDNPTENTILDESCVAAFLQMHQAINPETWQAFQQLPSWSAENRETVMESLDLSFQSKSLINNLLNSEYFPNWVLVRDKVLELPEAERAYVAYFVAISEASSDFWVNFSKSNFQAAYSDSDSVASVPLKSRFPWGRFWKADGWGALKGLVAGSVVFGAGSVYISKNARTKNGLWAGIGAGISVVFPVIDSYIVYRKYKLGYFDEPEIIFE